MHGARAFVLFGWRKGGNAGWKSLLAICASTPLALFSQRLKRFACVCSISCDGLSTFLGELLFGVKEEFENKKLCNNSTSAKQVTWKDGEKYEYLIPTGLVLII